MAWLIGGFVGGLLLITILAIIVEKLIFQRFLDDPVAGKLWSVTVGWLMASTLAGFGMADGGPYYWFAFVVYALPAIPVGLYFHRRGVALREDIDAGNL